MSGTRLAEQLESTAATLDELLGDPGAFHPPALAVAAATTVGILRAAAATVRDEHPDDSAAQPFAGSYLDEQAERIARSYREGHRDGWLSCIAAHGGMPDDPDDATTLADAGQLDTGRNPLTGLPGDPRSDFRALLAQTAPRPRTGG